MIFKKCILFSFALISCNIHAEKNKILQIIATAFKDAYTNGALFGTVDITNKYYHAAIVPNKNNKLCMTIETPKTFTYKNLETGKEEPINENPFLSYENEINAVTVSPKGDFIGCHFQERTFAIFDRFTKKLIKVLPCNYSQYHKDDFLFLKCFDIATVKNKTYAITRHIDCYYPCNAPEHITLWDLEDRSRYSLQDFKLDAGNKSNLILIPSNNKLGLNFVYGNENYINIVNGDTGKIIESKKIAEIKNDVSFITTLLGKCPPDEKKYFSIKKILSNDEFIIVMSNRQIVFLDIHTLKTLFCYNLGGSYSYFYQWMRLVPNTPYLITGISDSSFHVFDLKTKTLILKSTLKNKFEYYPADDVLPLPDGKLLKKYTNEKKNEILFSDDILKE